MNGKLRKALLAVASAVVVAGGVSNIGASPAFAGSYIGGVDMQRACNKQNPGMGLKAVVLDQRNAYSWRCRAPWGYAVGIDVNRACAEQYGRGAWSGLRDARNPYSWYCQR